MAEKFSANFAMGKINSIFFSVNHYKHEIRPYKSFLFYSVNIDKVRSLFQNPAILRYELNYGGWFHYIQF